MGNMHSFAKYPPFDPPACDAMGSAFDSAWQQLLKAGASLASSDYAAATREALAMQIIDLAQRGERDVSRLRDGAVAFVKKALER